MVGAEAGTDRSGAMITYPMRTYPNVVMKARAIERIELGRRVCDAMEPESLPLAIPLASALPHDSLGPLLKQPLAVPDAVRFARLSLAVPESPRVKRAARAKRPRDGTAA